MSIAHYSDLDAAKSGGIGGKLRNSGVLWSFAGGWLKGKRTKFGACSRYKIGVSGILVFPHKRLDVIVRGANIHECGRKVQNLGEIDINSAKGGATKGLNVVESFASCRTH